MTWIPIILFSTLIFAGQAAWAIAILNGVLHFALHRVLRETIVAIVLVAAVVVPIVALADMGRSKITRFSRGQWDAVPAAWRVYTVFCTVGAAGGIVLVGVNRRRMHPAAVAVVHRQSEPIDIAEVLGKMPAGRGIKSVFARIPGNELFHLDVSEMHVHVPTLPAALDGLSILHLTDPHLNGTPARQYFEHAAEIAQSLRPDLVALTGDIIDRPSLSKWLPTTLGRLSNAPLGAYFILGNHDIDHRPDDVRAAMTEHGWIDLGGTSIVREHAGQRLLLAGTERPWHGAHPTLPVTEGIALRILLSHTPRWFDWARQERFDLMLAGHLHGGQVRLPLLGAIIGTRYACGTFQAGDTVMHVSRGLGQMTPLRWRCLPEMTKIVLQSSSTRR